MKNILVIEDNSIIANIYRGALAKAGFCVEIAGDGQAGLAAAARIRPDLILLDLMLPKIDGVSVLRQLRANPDFASTPIIVSSNSYSASRAEEIWQAGATQLITKASSSPKELVRIVQEALGGRSGG